MDIEQYRAFKAKELDEANQPEPKEETQAEETIDQPIEEIKEETKEETKPEITEVEIDGQKVALDELKKGYLRQSDLKV